MIYVGILDHGIERVVSAAGLKFMPDMVFPQPHQVGVRPVPASFGACLLMAFPR
jgi:hypothetical protein